MFNNLFIQTTFLYLSFNKDFSSLQKWQIEIRFQDGKGRVNVTKKQMASRGLKCVLRGDMPPQYARRNHTPNLTETVIQCTDYLIFCLSFHSGIFQSRILKEWLQAEVVLSARSPLLLIQIEQMEAVVTREVPVGSGPRGALHGAYCQDARVYLWEVEQVAEQTQHRAGLRTRGFPSWAYRQLWASHTTPSSLTRSSCYSQQVAPSPAAAWPRALTESVCVLFCGSLYILPTLEMAHNWLPSPAPLGSSIPQLQCNNLQGTPPPRRDRLAMRSLLITLSITGHTIQGNMKSCPGNTHHLNKIYTKILLQCNVAWT